MWLAPPVSYLNHWWNGDILLKKQSGFLIVLAKWCISCWWLGVRLWYLQCFDNGDTTVLICIREATNRWLHNSFTYITTNDYLCIKYQRYTWLFSAFQYLWITKSYTMKNTSLIHPIHCKFADHIREIAPKTDMPLRKNIYFNKIIVAWQQNQCYMISLANWRKCVLTGMQV